MATLSDIKSTLSGADIIDVRDLIERYEDLVASIGNHDRQAEDDDEMNALRAILDDLRGEGGDEQWRGDWYPGALIHDRYFKDYARELLEDCDFPPPRDLPHYVVIDWEATARNIRSDYTCIDIDGDTYWYR